MKVITMDCGREIGYNDTKAAVDLVKAHILGCRTCNLKITDLGVIECGRLYTVDGHMSRCVEVVTVCNPYPPYGDEQRTYVFEVLPKRG